MRQQPAGSQPARWKRALTGLAAGALVTAPLLALFALGSLGGVPSVPFGVFEWLIRVLPGRLVIFGLETTLSTLEGLGLDIKNTAKVAEEALALTSLFAGGLVAGALFFALADLAHPLRVRRYGLSLGFAVGLFSLIVLFIQRPTTGFLAGLGLAVWVLGSFAIWGWGLARLHQFAYSQALAVSDEAAWLTGRPAENAAPPVEQAPRVAPVRPRGQQTGPPAGEPPGTTAREQPSRAAGLEAGEGKARAAEAAETGLRRLSRRRFLIEVGGAVATVLFLGAEVGEVVRVKGGPGPSVGSRAPIPFPNAGSPVKPVLGTRPEYTPVADHYRVDIDLTPPSIDASSWRLRLHGLVERPLALTLEEIRTRYTPVDQFITLSCISNPVGGPLIGTTLWTGARFRDVLVDAVPKADARWAHLVSEDGFDEVVNLAMIMHDSRIVLAYDWNGQPLPADHGFPLRVYVPGVYGMKQPKWITDIALVADDLKGYWVQRGWNQKAEMRTTSVVDTVATEDISHRGGHLFVPVGGIAHAGDRGISRVEVKVDDGSWNPAELRQPLSGLTWLIWRYEWPFAVGDHVFSVRAFDGRGRLQITTENPTFPAGATGIDSKKAPVLPPT